MNIKVAAFTVSEKSISRYYTFQGANNNHADQPARMHGLACAFVVAYTKGAESSIFIQT